MADHDANQPDSDHPATTPPDRSPAGWGPVPPDAIQRSLFTTDDAAHPSVRSSTPTPHDTPIGHDQGRRPLGSEILQLRNQVYPPRADPAFDRVAGGYHQHQVDEYLRQLTAWSRRETHRADSAEQTLRAMVEGLPDLGRQPDASSRTPAPAPSPVQPPPDRAGGRSGEPPPDPTASPPPPIPPPHLDPTATGESVERPRRRWYLAGLAAAVVVLAVAVSVYGLLDGKSTGNADAATPRLTLTSSQVTIGTPYSVSGSGFLPGESVQPSWTGPTHGLMDTCPADHTGTASTGPIIEREPPGNYVLIMTGLTSGRSATARLQVLPNGAHSATTPHSPTPGGDAQLARPGQPGG